MHSVGYPNFDYYMPLKPVRDTVKWVKVARELYYQIHKGANRQQALQTLTNDWDIMEKQDFTNWLKYYEEGVPNKYKQAQTSYWGDQNNLGYYLPMPQESKPMDTHNLSDMTKIQNPQTHPDVIQQEKQQEKREIIERQRQKIIGRLDSAEKLLRTPEGQMFAGTQDEELIEAIYQLKKKIHLVNKISTSVRLYQDMIVREANVLGGKGHRAASQFLIKMAQEIPSVVEPPNPAVIGDGQVGSIPGQLTVNETEGGAVPGQDVGQTPPDGATPSNVSVDVSQSGTPPEVAPNLSVPSTPSTLSSGMKEFLDSLNTDNPEKEEDDLEVNEDVADADFIAEAQAVDAAGLAPEPVSEVVEEAPTDPEVSAGKDFDQMIDQTLNSITVADVVNKLEDVAKIFKTRELSRQLSIIDLMLDKLGLAALFPELNEAITKSGEMSGYVSSRVETIITKLRGTMTTKDIDLKNDNAPPPSPIAQQLQDGEEKEKARKQMRKEVENQKLEAPKPVAPTVEMQQDLSQPAQVAPAPVNPPNTPLV